MIDIAGIAQSQSECLFFFVVLECWGKCSIMTITVTVSPELLASRPMYFFAHIGWADLFI